MTAKDQARRVVEEWKTTGAWIPCSLDASKPASFFEDDLIARLTPIFEAATANAMDHTQLTNWRERAEQAEAEVEAYRRGAEEIAEAGMANLRREEEYAKRVEAERDQQMNLRDDEHRRYIEAANQRDALVAAIQRGYCPDSENCDYGSPVWYDHRNDDRVTEHSPDCRVAPLLGGEVRDERYSTSK